MGFQLQENFNQLIQMFHLNEESDHEKIGTVSRFINTVILKPTYECNADCDYCCSPPEDNKKWTVEKFKVMFDRIEPILQENCTFIWHGGEPMLLSPRFYDECCEYVKTKLSDPVFAMQSNLTRYSREKWNPILKKHFNSSVSTSYDADETHRTINGDPALYAKRFKRAYREIGESGFSTGVITVLDKTNYHTVDDFIDFVVRHSDGKRMVGASINNMVASGRKEDDGSLLSSKEYADVLVHALKRWCDEKLEIRIEPLSSMLSSYINGSSSMRCGNNHSCARGMLLLDWDGGLSTCDELREIGGSNFTYGNIFSNTIDEIVSSDFFKTISSRVYSIPFECRECDAFIMCKGGCPAYVLRNGGRIEDKDPRCEQFKILYKTFVEMERSGKLDWARKFLTN